MESISPYKDRRSRGTILGLAVILLMLLNGFFLIIVKYPDVILPYVLLVCLLGLGYWFKRRDYSGLRYVVDESQIDIVRGVKLLRSVPRKQILTIEHTHSLPAFSLKNLSFPWLGSRGVYTSGTTYHARLSITNLTKITMNTYEEIWLSGKIT